jgi:hypothetical protein
VPLDFGEELEGGKQESNQNRRVNTNVNPLQIKMSQAATFAW